MNTLDDVRHHLDAQRGTLPLNSAAFAAQLDAHDPFALQRDAFHFPSALVQDAHASSLEQTEQKVDHSATASSSSSSSSSSAIYLCGNSLGLQPKRSVSYVHDEMSKWGARGVEGHFSGARPWVSIDEPCLPHLKAMVGAASVEEVGVMNSLSVNLHLLMTSFYQPKGDRIKLMIEEAAFCSDHHVARSQLVLHNLTEQQALIQLRVRPGETHLRTEDIEAAIAEAGDTLALVMLPGVQFYTGQALNIARITAAAHAVGAYAGFDLAHAIGNVPLQLHDDQVDFAAWCTYKYLNSGPGAIAGLFLHSKHHGANLPVKRLAGWWGQTPEVRFKMNAHHVPIQGAQAYQLSNPPVLPTVCLQASLETFTEAGGVAKLREKSILLTGYLQLLLEPIIAKLNIVILTPSALQERGCQLSLLLPLPIRGLLAKLEAAGVICDGREPNVIRVAPTPLYNSFTDVQQFVERFQVAFQLESSLVAAAKKLSAQ